MGLDMYLSAKVSLWRGEKDERVAKVRKVIETEYVGLYETENRWIGGYAVIPLVYWRKENAIHKWFVDHCQDGEDDCKEYDVSREQLQELLDTCKEVLKDHSKAAKLLPTQEGFFFGYYEYGRYYFEGLKMTAVELARVLKHLPFDAYIKYQSSW